MKGFGTVFKSLAAGAVALSVLAASSLAQAEKVTIRVQSVIPSKADEVHMLNEFAKDARPHHL